LGYNLEQFAVDCRAALETGANATSLETVRANVSRACLDQTFVETYLGDNNKDPRKLLYQDDKLGFCIFAHAHAGAADGGKPHDHGPSWAVYGQAVGTTEMTDWRVDEGDPKRVRATRTYELQPGDAYTYGVGDIHSPSRAGSTRLIRVEGINMDAVERRWFESP